MRGGVNKRREKSIRVRNICSIGFFFNNGNISDIKSPTERAFTNENIQMEQTRSEFCFISPTS